jgi:hypothetical protein
LYLGYRSLVASLLTTCTFFPSFLFTPSRLVAFFFFFLTGRYEGHVRTESANVFGGGGVQGFLVLVFFFAQNKIQRIFLTSK